MAFALSLSLGGAVALEVERPVPLLLADSTSTTTAPPAGTTDAPYVVQVDGLDPDTVVLLAGTVALAAGVITSGRVLGRRGR